MPLRLLGPPTVLNQMRFVGNGGGGGEGGSCERHEAFRPESENGTHF